MRDETARWSPRRRSSAARSAAPSAAPTTAAARAAIAAITAITSGRYTLLGGAEVAELLACLSFPEVLERRGRTRCAIVACGRLAPRACFAVAAIAGFTGAIDVVVADDRERELAVLVDVVDAHFELVAERQHVFDAIDPLASAQLGDVHQAVAARKDVHEGAELRDVHDASLVDRTNLGRRRVEDQLDATLGLLDRGAVLRADRHEADAVVVLHRDVGAGLLLDRVDDLALGPDDLADLVDRDLEADDLRCGVADLFARLVDRGPHHPEDLEPGVLRLQQRLAEHVGGNAVDLRVELQRGHELFGARDLEVHVAEGVLGAEDVGQRRVLAFG